ncbi:MAG: transposase [Steroidobacteraceae bacterium]
MNRVKSRGAEPHAVVEALQSLGGVAQISAVSIMAELGKLSRFPRARQLMGYSRAVP